MICLRDENGTKLLRIKIRATAKPMDISEEDFCHLSTKINNRKFNINVTITQIVFHYTVTSSGEKNLILNYLFTEKCMSYSISHRAIEDINAWEKINLKLING